MAGTAAGERERRAWSALAEVPDPEIPVVSVVDLGMVRSVRATGQELHVELLPTFVGCPALDLIRAAALERLAGIAPVVEVEFSFAEPWTSQRITAQGRRKLRESGFAPPDLAPAGSGGLLLDVLPRTGAACPWCGSPRTRLENPFGPTRCRSIWWCDACRQPFEQFKTI